MSGLPLYNVVNTSDIILNGIMIKSWSYWFSPYASQNDFNALVMYPAVESNTTIIVGHSANKWFARIIG